MHGSYCLVLCTSIYIMAIMLLIQLTFTLFCSCCTSYPVSPMLFVQLLFFFVRLGVVPASAFWAIDRLFSVDYIVLSICWRCDLRPLSAHTHHPPRSDTTLRLLGTQTRYLRTHTLTPLTTYKYACTFMHNMYTTIHH